MITGVLDAPTRQKMDQPRCGVPDVGEYSVGVTEDRKWHSNNLTYSIDTFTGDLPNKTVRFVFHLAWQVRILKGAYCDHFFTILNHLKLVEIFISHEKPYFSHQHTEI